MADPTRILYVAYWGLLEPLGQSLIESTIREITARGDAVGLVTFDKPQDLASGERMAAARRRMDDAGATWAPLRYHKRPTIPATLWDVVQGVRTALSLGRRLRPDVIHGRTFVGAIVAAITARLTGRPWVYHAEGFWPEQQVEGGFWARTSLVYRTTTWIDRRLYRRADGIVVLSRAAQRIVESDPVVKRRGTPIVVVGSSVDRARFEVPRQPPTDGTRRLAYVGSLEGRYLLEPLGAFLMALRRFAPAELVILSPSDPVRIRRAMENAGVPPEIWSLRRVAHTEVPQVLAGVHAGLHFIRSGLGGESGSPTKIGEYWASGIPVVTTARIGDAEALIRERRVGVVLDGLEPAHLARAAGDLQTLLADPELASRCRQAAADAYDLRTGIDVQLRLYRILQQRRAPCP